MARILAPLFLMATPVAASEGTQPGQPWLVALGLAALAVARVARRAPVLARATK